MDNQKILLDTNILIAALNDPQSNAAQKLRETLRQENSTVFITPLIRYEVLRGIQWDNADKFNEVENWLNSLTSLNIEKTIANLASELFRFEKYMREKASEQSKKIDKHNFDIMHFATAKIHQLIFLSDDKDITTW